MDNEKWSVFFVCKTQANIDWQKKNKKETWGGRKLKESKYISSKKKSRKDRNCDIAWLKGDKKHLCGISTNSQKNAGITLVALVITILFSYDEKLKCSNSKGFLL